MNRNFKRNMVVATVMLFVCAAVYLNWKYAGNVAQTEEAVETKTLGESTLVSKTETDSDSSAADEAAVYGEDGDYFATARLTRQQARDNALSLLQEAGEIWNFLWDLTERTGVPQAVFSPLMKTVGIAIVTKIGSDLCRDAGESALASLVETAGAICAILAALPLLQSVIELVEEMI